MDLLLIFFLLALILQGIKLLANYLISRSPYFDGPVFSQPDETDYVNQLSPVPVHEPIDQKNYMRVSPEAPSRQSDQTKTNEVFMPPSFHQSA